MPAHVVHLAKLYQQKIYIRSDSGRKLHDIIALFNVTDKLVIVNNQMGSKCIRFIFVFCMYIE